MMRIRTTSAVLLGMLTLALIAPPIWARGGGGGGGGRGGGGGFGGGGGGGFSGGGQSGGGFRPAAPAARPAARPATPQRPPATRPSPGAATGKPANRPSVVHTPGGGSGMQVGARPQTRPGGAVSRPDLKPGASTKPAGPGVKPGAKPGPGTLPGLPGAGNIGTGRPGAGKPGNKPGVNQVTNRPVTLPGMQPGRPNGPGYYPGHPGHYPNGPHGNYHPYYHGPYGSHGGWYHGYGPAWGNGRWNYLWNQYPVAMAFGVTSWGINTAGYLFGCGSYYNPYYDSGAASEQVVDYSQPVVADPNAVNSGEPPVSEDPAATADASADPATQAFDQARTAFFSGDYAQALKFTDQALKISPRDAAINEFRSQCLFALGRYPEAAATIHAVLAAGPGWDWTTQASLYPKVEDYTGLLRKLEAFTKANPQAADASFLLGYHYLTCGYAEAAVKEFQTVVKLQPKDTLAAQLLQTYSPEAADAAQPTPENAPTETTPAAYPPEKLAGTWKAQEKTGQFTLVLGQEADFTWSFTQGGQPQTLSGDYEVHGNQLVLEPAAGGAMISEITLQDDQTMVFSPVGQATKMTFEK